MEHIWRTFFAFFVCHSRLLQFEQIYGQKETEELIELDKPIPITDVSGVLWHKAFLPCDITSTGKDDIVYMVLWYKAIEPEPIYSFDIRNRVPSHAKLWSSEKVFGSRAVFKASTKPASLQIDNVQLEDEAEYRCRVDFKNSPTRNLKVNFTVIVLPGRPIIYDSLRKEIETLLEDRNEGSTLSLTCEVTGGRPQPDVLWYLDDKLIDNTYERKSSSLTINQLNDLKLSREHLNARLICKANNTNNDEASSRLVILNINLKPLKVEILQKNRALSVDHEYEIECLATGSRPEANITWFLGEKPSKYFGTRKRQLPVAEHHQIISILKFSPSIEDHGKYITCRAENMRIKNSAIEDRWHLNVQYFPQVTLKMGHNLDPQSIKEGDDVYFECDIRCNPKAFRQAWYHNGEEIHQNVTAGVILTETSLVLQKVTKHASGNYTCMAANTEGKGTSNPVTLQIMFAPSCKLRREQLYGALKHETVLLKCEVDANPKPLAFHWTFNNSGDSSLVSPSRYTYSGFISIIKYTPVTDMDYGTLACWAQNPVGDQKRPCLYQVVAAGRPLPLINCSITNQTEDSLQVQCIENFNGGLPQHFFMELLELPVMESKFNISVTSHPPVFYVQGVDSTTSYKVKLYAVNAKGLSDPIYLETSSFKGAAKYTGVTRSLQVVGVVTGLISILFILTVLLCIFGTSIAFYRCRHKYKQREQDIQPKHKNDEFKEQPFLSAVFVRSQQPVGDAKGPDIITNTCGNRACNEFVGGIPPTLNNGDQIQKECGVNFKIPINSCDRAGNDVLFSRRIFPAGTLMTGNENMDTVRQSQGESSKQDTFIVQPRYSRLSPEVVTASMKLQESCI